MKRVSYQQYEYPETVARYLEPFTKIESNNEKITKLAAEILKPVYRVKGDYLINVKLKTKQK